MSATSPDARASVDTVRHDFDRIARALEATGLADEPLQPCERALLAHVPPACERVLEVGCGHGALARQVAPRAGRVLAIDLSPEMIRVAHERSAAHPNVEFRVADVATMALEPRAYDVVLSVATLHHLPFEPTVRRLADAVRPGGLLVVQDILARDGVRYLPVNALAWLARRVRGGRRPGAEVVERLYAEHGRDERYLTPREARERWAAALPGARVIHHLEWRYTAAWRRSAVAAAEPQGLSRSRKER